MPEIMRTRTILDNKGDWGGKGCLIISGMSVSQTTFRIHEVSSPSYDNRSLHVGVV